jgi:hypothetical protein
MVKIQALGRLLLNSEFLVSLAASGVINGGDRFSFISQRRSEVGY